MSIFDLWELLLCLKVKQWFFSLSISQNAKIANQALNALVWVTSSADVYLDHDTNSPPGICTIELKFTVVQHVICNRP